MIKWLHRYIFRGYAFALLTGALTALYLAYNQIQQQGR